MRSLLQALVLGAFALFPLGCGKYYATPTSDPVHGAFTKQMQQLELRAPSDLGCAAGEISYKVLGNTAIAAEGCTRRITYQYIQGSWIMESSSTGAAERNQTAPPGE